MLNDAVMRFSVVSSSVHKGCPVSKKSEKVDEIEQGMDGF